MSKNIYDEEKFQLELMDKISYECKDSLTAILGFSQIVNKNCQNGQQKKLLGNIITSSERLLTFLNNLSSFSGFASGKHQKISHLFSVKSLFLDILESFRVVIEKKNINLITDIADFNIRNDHRVISQILFTILNHITKITPQNGTIIIRSDEMKDMVLLEAKTNAATDLFEENGKNIHDILENKTDICANLDFFFIKSLLEIAEGSVSLGKDENQLSSLKLYLPKGI